jgi:hypothetical protein
MKSVIRWLVLVVGAVIAYVTVVHRFINRWGATATEVQAALPGDEHVPQPQVTSTRAITIEAPVHTVWQWLVQIGQGRGGFYSYDFLENLLGLDIHSTDRIQPELQTLQPGDLIHMGPEGPYFKVLYVEPEQALVLMGGDPDKDDADPTAPDYYGSTWSFILKPLDDQTTRLVIRGRGATNVPALRIMNYFLEPIIFIMEQKMLRGIKQRAEADGYEVSQG